MSSLTCNRCGQTASQEDNFCRRCGHQLTVDLPTVQKPNLPARNSPVSAGVASSVALLALGTGLEWLARRAAGSAARAAGRALVGGSERLPGRKTAAKRADDATVDELIYIRKVQVRR